MRSPVTRPWRVALVLALGLAGPSDRAADRAAESLYAQATGAMETGRVTQAREIFERLVEDYPDFYTAYPSLWIAIGKTSDPDDTLDRVKQDLAGLARVPRRERDDDFYDAVMQGNDWLGDTDRIEAWRREAVTRRPTGRIARAARLKAAREEKDPRRSAALYESLLDQFPGDAKLGAEAAGAELDMMSDHRDLFPTGTLLKAAARLEGFASGSPLDPADPDLYVASMLQISDALAERAPADSLACAARGLAWIEKTWPASDGVEEAERFLFWPTMMKAYGTSGDWRAARRLGKVLVDEIESGDVPPLQAALIGEGRARAQYADALERTGSIEEARLQLGLAAALDAGFESRVAAFSARHPMTGAQRRRFDTSLAAQASRTGERREALIKRKLLATAERRPAAAFTLKDLGGRPVALSDYRGRTLVLSFWATFCPECRAEMKAMEAAYLKYRRNPGVAFAAVSIDMEKAKVIPFLKDQGVTLPVLISDGSIEESYCGNGIPQIYVIDPAGRIRFHHEGWLDDGYGQKRLDWMIASAAD
ncbi:MAG: hypothetical protein DMF51_07380 [Acidobacteria bacterium]|nr:MAG: hypothetical protein DMF51_07380 [Acidobacteriota bacterium]